MLNRKVTKNNHPSSDSLSSPVFIKNKKKYAFLIGLITIILGLGVGLFLWNVNKQNNIALQVGGTIITIDEYNAMLVQYNQEKVPNKLSKEAITDYIIETYTIRSISDEVGIAVNEQEINETVESVFNDTDGDYSNWQRIVAENTAYKKKIEQAGITDKRVARFVFPFSRNFASGQETLPAGFGSQEAINTDTEYASQRANEVKELIVKDLSENNLDKLLQDILNDERLIYGHAGNRSMIFNYDQDNGKAYVNINESRELGSVEREQISQLETGVSDIYTEQQDKYYAAIKDYQYDGVPNAYYFFVIIPNNVDNDIQTKVNSMKEQVKVIRNV